MKLHKPIVSRELRVRAVLPAETKKLTKEVDRGSGLKIRAFF